MTTPAGVTKCGKLMALGRRRGSSVRVRFFVVMMGEMIECLNSRVGGGMERDAIFASAVKIFENMKSSLVVLMAGIGVVRSKEGECRCDIRSCARG